VTTCERNNSADTKVSEGGEGGGAPGAGVEVHLQPMEKTIVRQAVPSCPRRSMTEPGGCQKEAVTLWKAHAGAGFWQDLWTHGERIPHWSRFAVRSCTSARDPRWSSLFLKGCNPWEGPKLEQGQSVRRKE